MFHSIHIAAGPILFRRAKQVGGRFRITSRWSVRTAWRRRIGPIDAMLAVSGPSTRFARRGGASGVTGSSSVGKLHVITRGNRL